MPTTLLLYLELSLFFTIPARSPVLRGKFDYYTSLKEGTNSAVYLNDSPIV